MPIAIDVWQGLFVFFCYTLLNDIFKEKTLPASVRIVSFEFIIGDNRWQVLCNCEKCIERYKICVDWFWMAIEFKLFAKLLLWT